MLVLSSLNKDWKKNVLRRGSSYLVCLRCLCACDTTYWLLLWDQKLPSFISLDSESSVLGQQLQGGLSKYFPPRNPSCLKESKETLVLLPESYPWLQARYCAAVPEVVGWSVCGICCEQLWFLTVFLKFIILGPPPYSVWFPGAAE